MNKRGYVYFIEIIFAVILAFSLFTSLQVTSLNQDRTVEINSLIAYDLLRELHNHNIIGDDAAYNSVFVEYFIDSYLPDNFGFYLTSGTPDISALGNQDLSYAEYAYRDSTAQWSILRLYVWSKL